MFDLSKNNLSEIAEAGIWFDLVMPDTLTETGARIKVRGSDSPTVRKVMRKIASEQTLKAQKAKRQGKEHEPSFTELDELNLESAVARIIDWQGIGENGVEIPFTKENAERVLSAHNWIMAAVIDNSTDGSKFRPE